MLCAEEQWTAYKKANAAIANAVRAMVGPSPDNDLIWIHNYHLLQVPFELRKLGITSRIGTPSPPSYYLYYLLLIYLAF